MAAVTADTVAVEMEAKVSAYMADVKRAADRFDADMARMERAAGSTERATNQAFMAIRSSLAGIAAAFGVREVLNYAEAWTKAKNSLAVADVTGTKQIAVLEQLYQSAQRNAAPLESLTSLYGKATQAQRELGATSGQLLQFTDGVATALRVAGTDATQAQGALLQLGQALGSGTVRAEEFNSVLEGARPILTAVANGLEGANGSIAKLKDIVNDGKLSSKEFFEAFLRGLPTIQAQAANASLTISQAFTKVQNAFTKYIGQTDEGASASARLAAGLSALADNFNTVGDVALKLIAIISAGLLGRAIGPMIAALGVGSAALVRFAVSMTAAASASVGLRTAAAGMAASVGALGAAAGPVGLVLGTAIAGALVLFTSQSAAATQGATTYAEALRKIEAAANPTATAVENMSRRLTEAQKLAIENGIRAGTTDIENLKAKLGELFTEALTGWQSAFMTETARSQIQRLQADLLSGRKSADEVKQELAKLGREDVVFRDLANAVIPLLTRLENARRGVAALASEMRSLADVAPAVAGLRPPTGTIAGNMGFGDPIAQRQATQEFERRNRLTADQLKLEEKINELRRDPRLYAIGEARLKELAEAAIAADKRRSEEGGGSSRTSTRATADQRIDRTIQDTRDRIDAMRLETELVGKSNQESERRRMQLSLEQDALRDLREEARRKGETDLASIQLSAEQRAKIEQISAAYAAQAEQLRKVTENQERAKQSASEFYDAFKSNMIGAITGAKSLTEALAGVLKKLADILLNSAFDMLFKPSGGGGAFGFLTSLFGGGFGGFGGGGEKIGFKAAGGDVAAGQPLIVGERRPELFVPRTAGKILPNVSAFDAAGRTNSGGPAIVYSPTIDARGADADAVARLERAMARDKQEFDAKVNASIKKQQKSGMI